MACSSSNTDIEVVLPIYWTKCFKTKPDKTILMSMNWYRNAYHRDQNDAKKYFSELVHEQIGTVTLSGQYRLHLELYYKNPACDGANVAALMEKFVLDALQSADVVVNDNVKYHLGSTWTIAERDVDNPRCVIRVIEEEGKE